MHRPFIFDSLWLNAQLVVYAVPILLVTVPVGATGHCEQSAG